MEHNCCTIVLTSVVMNARVDAQIAAYMKHDVAQSFELNAVVANVNALLTFSSHAVGVSS